MFNKAGQSGHCETSRRFDDSSIPVDRHPLGLQRAGPPPLLTVDWALGQVQCKEETYLTGGRQGQFLQGSVSLVSPSHLAPLVDVQPPLVHHQLPQDPLHLRQSPGALHQLGLYASKYCCGRSPGPC